MDEQNSDSEELVNDISKSTNHSFDVEIRNFIQNIESLESNLPLVMLVLEVTRNKAARDLEQFLESKEVLNKDEIPERYGIEVNDRKYQVEREEWRICKKIAEKIILNLKIGQIPVNLHYADQDIYLLWMQQKQPVFSQEFAVDTLAKVLNIEPSEIDSKFPIQEISTGVPFIIVPLKSQATLKRIKVNQDKYFELINNTQAKSILVFCPETYNPENNLSVRVFADYLGVPEDPATGSANGCLAGYLVHYSYFGEESINLRVEQGYEIGRPSLLLLKAQKSGDSIEVSVGGKVVMVAKGEFV